MAHFYGEVQGSRGAACRMGGAAGGLHTKAASWQGCVHVQLSEKDGVDHAHVYVTNWGYGCKADERTLYSGPIGSGDAMPAGGEGLAPGAAAKAMDAIVERAAEMALVIVRDQAQRLLDSSPRYSAFASAMGVSALYGRDGKLIRDEHLTDAGRKVLALAAKFTECFGSPGLHLKRKISAKGD